MASEEAESTATTAVSATVTALAVICVALRFYTRRSTRQGIAWDDWWVLVSLLLTLLAGVLLLWGNAVDPHGGRIIDEAPADFDTKDHTLFLKFSFLTSILYFSIVCAVKLSILLLYRRIFAVNASFRHASLVVAIVVGMFWLTSTITTLANCVPLKYSWIGLSLPQHCINYNIFWMATGAVEVVLDTVILFLPLPSILRLQLSPKRKAFIIAIFLLGGLVVITGLLRVIYAYVPGRRVPNYSKAELWSAVHTGMAIVCTCLPTLRGLFIRKAPRSGSTETPRQFFGLRSWVSKSGGGTRASAEDRDGYAVEVIPLTRDRGPEGSLAETASLGTQDRREVLEQT